MRKLIANEVEPTFICHVPSGVVHLCTMQYLSGYCILRASPTVESINSLSSAQRILYLSDMALVGDAILEVTGAYRINYAIMGNSDPCLHAHIVPRFKTESDNLRKGLPWSYPKETIDNQLFNAERDQMLIQRLRQAIMKRL